MECDSPCVLCLVAPGRVVSLMLSSLETEYNFDSRLTTTPLGRRLAMLDACLLTRHGFESGNKISDETEIYQLRKNAAYANPMFVYSEAFQFATDQGDWLLGSIQSIGNFVNGVHPESVQSAMAKQLYDSLLYHYSWNIHVPSSVALAWILRHGEH